MFFSILCITIITSMLASIFIASNISPPIKFNMLFIIPLFSMFPDNAEEKISFISKSSYTFSVYLSASSINESISSISCCDSIISSVLMLFSTRLFEFMSSSVACTLFGNIISIKSNKKKIFFICFHTLR